MCLPQETYWSLNRPSILYWQFFVTSNLLYFLRSWSFSRRTKFQCKASLFILIDINLINQGSSYTANLNRNKLDLILSNHYCKLMGDMNTIDVFLHVFDKRNLVWNWAYLRSCVLGSISGMWKRYLCWNILDFVDGCFVAERHLHLSTRYK